MGVLALQGGVREHEEALADCGADVTRVRESNDLDGLDGLLIPGGESTTISLLAKRSGMFEPIQELIALGCAVYGSCAGMIMLADEVLDGRADRPSFGGIDMSVRRNAFGRQVDSFEADIDVTSIPDDSFPAVFIRAPWVERVGPAVEVVATVSVAGRESGPGAADEVSQRQTSTRNDGAAGNDGALHDSAGKIVAVRQGRLFATSFHPELTPDRRVHQYFLEIVKGDA